MRVAADYPWRLAEGNVTANLQALADDSGPLHGVTKKIRDLVGVEYPLHRIVPGVQLLAEVQWTSTSVEQGHGSAATLYRLHKQYGANMLCQRSLLHMMRHLVPTDDGDDRIATKLEREEATLEAKRPQYFGGCQAFFRDLMAAAKASHEEPLSQKAVRSLMSKHSGYF